MKMKLAVLAGVVLLLGASAFADTWSFTAPPNVLGSQGTSHVYLSAPGGVSITAYGYVCDPNGSGVGTTVCTTGSTGTASDMWIKDGGTGEQGLGISNDPSGSNPANPQHEIYPYSFVALDLTNLFAAYGPTLTITLNSSTQGETGLFYQSSSSSAVGASVGSIVGNPSDNGFGTGTFTLNQSDGNYLQLSSASAGGNNILLYSITTPEPSGLMLMGSGLIGLAGMLRRRLSR